MGSTAPFMVIDTDILFKGMLSNKTAYRHTGFSHIADNSFVVGIIATVGGQVKCHRKTFLSRSQVAAIESIRFFGGRESRILPNGPRTHGIHSAVRTSQIGRNTGNIVEVFHAFEVGFGVDGFYGNLFGSYPVGIVVLQLRMSAMGESIGANIYVFEIRSHSVMLLSHWRVK